MKKFLLTVLILVVLLAVSLVLFKNQIAKAAVEMGSKIVLGLDLKMQGLDVGFPDTFIKVDGLKVYNPKGFKDPILMDMTEFYVDYDLPSIMKGKIYLPELRIFLKEFGVVRNENGALNINSIKAVQKQQQSTAAQQAPAGTAKPSEPVSPLNLQIDRFQLYIGKVTFKDYSTGRAIVQEFPLNLNEQYTDITNPNKLVSLIVAKVMMNTPLAMLTGFNVKALTGGMNDILSSSTKLAQQTFDQSSQMLIDKTKQLGNMTPDSFKTATNNLSQNASELTDTLKSKTGVLKDKFKGFGQQ